MMDKVTLQPGDYVDTADIKDEGEYHAIARAFMEAGCKGWPEYHDKSKRIQGWSALFGRYVWDYQTGNSFTRQLTPAQILATPQWVPEVGERVERKPTPFPNGPAIVLSVSDNKAFVKPQGCEARGIDISRLTTALTEEDRAVEEMMDIVTAADVRDAPDVCRVLFDAGYRKQPQPLVDLTGPANWRAGDVVRFIDQDEPGLTRGGEYLLSDKRGYLCVVDDDGDDRYFEPRQFVRP